jgi:hypothetical protein
LGKVRRNPISETTNSFLTWAGQLLLFASIFPFDSIALVWALESFGRSLVGGNSRPIAPVLLPKTAKTQTSARGKKENKISFFVNIGPSILVGP